MNAAPTTAIPTPSASCLELVFQLPLALSPSVASLMNSVAFAVSALAKASTAKELIWENTASRLLSQNKIYLLSISSHGSFPKSSFEETHTHLHTPRYLSVGE